MPSFGDRKKQDQMLVPATSAGKFAWVTITFSVSLSQELSWRALFCRFSFVYIPLAACFGFRATLDCPCWGARSCGIPSAAGDRQPGPWAGAGVTQRFPDATSGMLNPPAVAWGIY